jgi:Ca-activated chloride channel homolog
MLRNFILIVAVLCFYTQQPQPVSLSMIVTDTDHKRVNSVRKDQIKVFEDTVEQPILSIEADDRPVDYAIVIDSSGSFRRLLASALDAVALIIKNKRPVDEVFIEKFISSDKIEKYQEFTNDSVQLIESLNAFYVEGGQSAVIDALYMAVDHVDEHNKSNDGRRKVVIIITDGEDRNSFYKQEALINLLHETGVQVFTIGLTADLSKGRPGPREKAEKLLKTVAAESGGRFFFPANKDQLIYSAAEIVLDLQAQFRIKYQPTSDASKNGFHNVDVQFVSTDGMKRELVVPPGYFVGPRTPAKQEKKKR